MVDRQFSGLCFSDNRIEMLRDQDFLLSCLLVTTCLVYFSLLSHLHPLLLLLHIAAYTLTLLILLFLDYLLSLLLAFVYTSSTFASPRKNINIFQHAFD